MAIANRRELRLLVILCCFVQILQSFQPIKHVKYTQFTILMSREINRIDFAHLKEQNRYGIKRDVIYNKDTKSFQAFKPIVTSTSKPVTSSLRQFLYNCFLPSGKLSRDYYSYTLWRLAQRFVSATSSVFGTQALLLALGFKKSSLGVAAATTWVLKDALGKVSRILWASENGRKFDTDAKQVNTVDIHLYTHMYVHVLTIVIDICSGDSAHLYYTLLVTA